LSTVVLHCSAFEKNHSLYVSFLAFSSLSTYHTAEFVVVNKIEEGRRMHEPCTRAWMEFDNWKSMEYYTKHCWQHSTLWSM